MVMNVYLDTDVDRAIAKGVLEAFDYVDYLKIPYAGLGYLVASNDPIVYPEAPWRDFADGEATLARSRQLGLATAASLADFKVLDQERLRRQLSEVRPSTDDHPIVDYLNFGGDARQALVQ